MTKAHVLIVENEAMLYQRMKQVLERENYSVSDFVLSVPQAIASIREKRPDIVLLDIDLEGKQTGIDLGKQLNEQYKIPFIYITDLGDNETFYAGLNTKHEQFIVKTKPRLNSQEIIRAIQTVLKRNTTKNEANLPMTSEQESADITPKGFTGLVNYLDEIKNYGMNQITRVPVLFDDIAFFTTSSIKKEDNTVENLRKNYLRFVTGKNETFYLKSSLKEIQEKLPYHFIRINDHCIINLSPKFVEGQITRSTIRIQGEDFVIKSTYLNEFKRRLELLYPS